MKKISDIASIVTFFTLCSMAVMVHAQLNPQPKPASSSQEKSVSLTKEEKTEYDLNQAKIDNLNLRVQLLQAQISQQQQQLTQETRQLAERFAKAHALDPDKWFIDAAGVFRPVAKPDDQKPKDVKK